MTTEEREERLKKFSPEQLNGKIHEVRQGWNAPLRHLQAKDLKKDNDWHKAGQTIINKIGTGFLYALVGPSGPGKTQMGVEIMRFATTKLYSAYYATALRVLTEIQDTFGKDSPTRTLEVLARYRKVDLLVLDESEKRSDSQWANTQMFEMIDERYRDMTDTILISNLGRDQFVKSLWPSVASRMDETGGIIVCNWPSFRSS